MYGKVILSLALMAFVASPLANSLKCNQCNNVVDCEKPTTVSCDADHANATRDVLTNMINDIVVTQRTSYSCFIGVYNVGNQTVADVRGCIQTGTVTCNNQLLHEAWTRKTCKVCDNDLCNKPNSVGTFSSSIITMIALLVVAKVFVN